MEPEVGVAVVLPGVLAAAAGGRTEFEVQPGEGPFTVRDVLDGVTEGLPMLARRLRDERGLLRRYVNVFLDGDDVRRLDGLGTPVADGQEVVIIQSVAGG